MKTQKVSLEALIPAHRFACEDVTATSCLFSAQPLFDFVTGVCHGSPIPSDFLGEPFSDEDDVPIDYVDPNTAFGYDRFEREEFRLEAASRDRASKKLQASQQIQNRQPAAVESASDDSPAAAAAAAAE